MLFARQSPRRRALLTAITGMAVLGAAVAVFVAYQSGRKDPRSVPPPDVPGPVVLVPGYGGELDSLEALAVRIRATGREARVVALPDGGVEDLRAQAAAVDTYVREALRGGAASVDMIGHSAGGVVARIWAQDHDGAHKARRIITLGSPHHGANIAASGAAAVPGACPTACRQLVPGSALLAGLTVPVPHPPVWLSLWTEDDETVTPPESARLEGAINLPIQSLCPRLRLGHAELPTDPVVTSIVLQAIGPAPLDAPSANACVSS